MVSHALRSVCVGLWMLREIPCHMYVAHDSLPSFQPRMRNSNVQNDLQNDVQNDSQHDPIGILTRTTALYLYVTRLRIGGLFCYSLYTIRISWGKSLDLGGNASSDSEAVLLLQHAARLPTMHADDWLR